MSPLFPSVFTITILSSSRCKIVSWMDLLSRVIAWQQNWQCFFFSFFFFCKVGGQSFHNFTVTYFRLICSIFVAPQNIRKPDFKIVVKCRNIIWPKIGIYTNMLFSKRWCVDFCETVNELAMEWVSLAWIALRQKCLYLELFWSAFSRIRTEYGEILLISPYSVRMRENADQNNSEYKHFLRSVAHLLNLSNYDLLFNSDLFCGCLVYMFSLPISGRNIFEAACHSLPRIWKYHEYEV